LNISKETNGPLTCFKTYDVRGKLGINFDNSIAYRIGRAIAQHLGAKTMIVGRDARQSSPELAEALMLGVTDAGTCVLDIGLSGTEEMYWAVTEFCADVGVTITASHNPINYNGLKFVKSCSRPFDDKSDFQVIKRLAELNDWKINKTKGLVNDISSEARKAYVKKVLSIANLNNIRPLKVIVNSGNGAAGPTFDAIADVLLRENPLINFVRMNHEPDSSFPNGIPNPMLIENHAPMKNEILKNRADFGIAFDGDFDRCFFFDENGVFVSGEYIVGLLAQVFLDKKKNVKIVHDPRVIWNIEDVVKKHDGVCVQSKTGHAFIKEAMRKNQAVYGGELSAHHYFRDFAYCDSGMIPWLLIFKLVSDSDYSLGMLVHRRYIKFPSSKEINFSVKDPDNIIKLVEREYSNFNIRSSYLDGLNLEFEDWRLTLRRSNTEALLRLNIECKGSARLVDDKVSEVTKLIHLFNS